MLNLKAKAFVPSFHLGAEESLPADPAATAAPLSSRQHHVKSLALSLLKTSSDQLPKSPVKLSAGSKMFVPKSTKSKML